MFFSHFYSLLSRSHFPTKSTKSIFYVFNYFSSVAAQSSTSENPILCNYLIENLKFSEARALKICNKWSYIKSTEKPQAVVYYFRKLGFSEKQLQSSLYRVPQLLFSDVEETFEPKIGFFRELGLSDPDVVKLICKNPGILRVSLDRKMKPSFEIIKEVIENNRHKVKNKNDLMEYFINYNELAGAGEQNLRANISYLESIGIVGSSLLGLLRRRAWLFGMHESRLRETVSKAVDLGFAMDSGMLVYAIQSLICTSDEVFCKKKQLFQSYGFSEIEFVQIIRNKPTVLGLSEASLRCRIEFFLDTAKLSKLQLVCSPVVLTYSMQKRVIPRYRVLEAIKFKGLLSMEPNICYVLKVSDAKFLESYVYGFGDETEYLLAAYSGSFQDASVNSSSMKI